MKSINWKRVYTHIGIIAVFFVITAIYMRPLLEGKTLSQMDDKNAAGMSQELNQWEKQTGEYALWTNAMFGGMPAYLIKGGPSYNIYAHISRVIRFGTPYKSYAIMLSYLIAFYLAMLAFGFKPLYALLGAVAFGFSSYNFIIIEAGHVSKAYAIAYMAPVLGTFYMTFRGKYVWGGILTAFALGIQIAAAHPQITYYLFLTLALMAIAEAIHAIIKKTIKPYVKSIAVLGIAVVLAVLPNITNLMTTMEYGKSSIRGPSELSTPEGEVQHSGLDKTYALSWSYGKSETFTMLVPGIFGGGSTEALSENSEVYQTMQANRVPNAKQIVKQFPVYWGDMPFTSGPVYIGAIICFLFVLGLILVKGPARWWLLAATIFSIVLAWGRNFPLVTDFFFYNFPYYNKFRAVSMTLVVAGVTMPLLGLMAIREVLKKVIDKEKTLKAVYIAFGITGGLTFIIAILGSTFFSYSGAGDVQLPEWLINPLINDRKALASSDAWRSFAFILIAAGIIWVFLKGWVKKLPALLILIVLVLADMWPIDNRYLNEDDFVKSRKASAIQPSQTDQQILADKDPNFRVLNTTVNPFTDSRTSYFHKSIGGYHGAKMRRYQDLIDRHLMKNNFNVINMLNTKYFIVRNEQGQVFPQFNPGALGNAWFVSCINWVASPDDEIAALDSINPAYFAIIDKRFEPQLEGFVAQPDSTASIIFEQYKPDFLKYKSKSATPQLAVFSEIYYDKGWKAYIDGQEHPHFRTDYVLRGMVIPAGAHEIEFRFEPATYFTAQKIAGVSSGLIVLVLLAGLFIEFRKKKPAPEQEEKA